MFRKASLIALTAIGGFVASQTTAMADHGCRGGYYQPGRSVYSGFSGYRPPPTYYNSAYNVWGPGMYGANFGQPIPSTFSHGYSSYFGPSYGSGFNAPFGGYGVSGFPRHNTGAFGPGMSLYFGR